MPTSADRRAERGFTLLEIMATVGLVGLIILPLLTVREQASHRAYRASHMLRALHHAEQLLAKHSRDPEEYDALRGMIEDDEAFRYEVTVQRFDLSTGMTEAEAEDDTYDDYEGPVPGDAGVPPEEEEDRDDPHLVRQYTIAVFWPSLDGEEGDEESAWDDVTLEGYLPRIWELDDDELADGQETP